MVWETHTRGTYDERFVPLPPSVSLQSIETSNNPSYPSTVTFSYSISDPVLFSVQLQWGPQTTISSDSHTTSTRLSIDQAALPLGITNANLWGSLYGIPLLYSSCQITGDTINRSDFAVSTVWAPSNQKPPALEAISVTQRADQQMHSFSYCMPPSGGYGLTARVVTTVGSLDTSVNAEASSRNMSPLFIVEAASYSTGENLTLEMPNGPTMPAQSSIFQSRTRGMNWPSHWVPPGTTTSICNTAFALELPGGTYPYSPRGCVSLPF